MVHKSYTVYNTVIPVIVKLNMYFKIYCFFDNQMLLPTLMFFLIILKIIVHIYTLICEVFDDCLSPKSFNNLTRFYISLHITNFCPI